MDVVEVVGWGGSALLVYSLLQTRVLRFRVLNLIASVVLVAYNAVIQVWPMVAMNLVIAAINVFHVQRLTRHRHDQRHYEVVPIGPDEPYLHAVLRRHRADIQRFNPGFDAAAAPSPDRVAFLVLADGETVGVVLGRRTGADTVQVELDYVLPRYRDFTPGEFVYRRGGPFSAIGVRRVVASRQMRDAAAYLQRVGFRPQGADRVLELT